MEIAPYSSRVYFECMVVETGDDGITARVETKDNCSIEDRVLEVRFREDQITRPKDDEDPLRVADRLEWILEPEYTDKSDIVTGIPTLLFVTRSLNLTQRAPEISEDDIQAALADARARRAGL